MRWYRVAEVVLPPIVPMAALFSLRGLLEYMPREVLIVVGLVSAVPLAIQLLNWTSRGADGRILHPVGVAIPTSLALLFPLEPTVEWIARQVPAWGKVEAGEPVPTSRPDPDGGTTRFLVHIHGEGNQRSYRFTGGTVLYAVKKRMFDDLDFDFDRQRGHWSNTSTTFFSLDRAAVAKYVKGSDDFSEVEAAALTDQIWDILNRYADGRDLPPTIDRYLREGEPSRIVCTVPPEPVYLVSCGLSLAILAAATYPWLRWYHRRRVKDTVDVQRTNL